MNEKVVEEAQTVKYVGTGAVEFVLDNDTDKVCFDRSLAP